MTPSPFQFSDEPHRRRHGPSGYQAYTGFKPWLRDEFAFRCVYCLERELWYPDREDSFSVDHVVPRSEDSDLIGEYGNLVYACTRCNSSKRELRLLDPTACGFAEHLELGVDGIFVGRTPGGADLIDCLNLNGIPALEVRRSYLRVLRLKEKYPNDPEVHQLYVGAFGYPDNMPDLRTLRAPGGNQRSGSELACYFILRQRGDLDEIY